MLIVNIYFLSQLFYIHLGNVFVFLAKGVHEDSTHASSLQLKPRKR